MTDPHPTPAAASPPPGPPPGVPLWDRVVRLLHWALAGSVLLCLGTAWLGPPAAMGVHYTSGAVAAAVLAARLIWGVFGPPAARFATYPLRPGQLMAHARAVWRREAAHWPGHPPLGALMVIVLLAGVGAAVLSGTLALGGQEQAGPLAFLLGFQAGHMAAEVHETLGLLVALAVGGHLLGVAVESRLMGENLARSMITGRRAVPCAVAGKPGRLGLGLGLMVVVVGAGVAGVMALSARPPLALRPVAAPAAYTAECGACHMAYPPALLPAAGWRAVMADLSDHFGEDASLPEPAASALAAWLTANGAETWDTKAGTAFRRADAGLTGRITASPFWQRRHHELPEALFHAPAVGSKANCRACHQDAAAGAFARAAIAVP